LPPRCCRRTALFRALFATMTTPIYLDHAATTPILPQVWEAMRPWCAMSAPHAPPDHTIPLGNAASSHRFGRAARRALEQAREQIAALLDAADSQLVFTSGATEANNLAVFGLVGAASGAIACSALEHPCVVEAVQQLAKRGYRVLDIPVERDGAIALPERTWGQQMPDDIRLVCVMLANHETGVVQPVREWAAALPEGVPLHCDAAAAAGKIALSFRQLNVAALTISAHKFGGPQGIGALVVRQGVKLRPQLFGGHQQHGLRPGTEPVGLAVGMAKALELSTAGLEENNRKVQQLRSRFLELLRRDAEAVVVHGADVQPLPHILNVAFPGCQADVLLMNLDLAGVACSTGSACSSGSLLPSPVLRAMNVGEAALRSAMRFSFAGSTTLAEVEDAAARIAGVVKRLRSSRNS
jgi:cysteine desulfurase